MLDYDQAFQALQSANKFAVIISVHEPNEIMHGGEGCPKDLLNVRRVVSVLRNDITQQPLLYCFPWVCGGAATRNLWKPTGPQPRGNGQSRTRITSPTALTLENGRNPNHLNDLNGTEPHEYLETQNKPPRPSSTNQVDATENVYMLAVYPPRVGGPGSIIAPVAQQISTPPIA